MEFLSQHFAQIMVLLVAALTIYGKLRKAVKSPPPGTKPISRMPDFGSGPGGWPARKPGGSSQPEPARDGGRQQAGRRETEWPQAAPLTRKEYDERRMWSEEGESSGEGPGTPDLEPSFPNVTSAARSVNEQNGSTSRGSGFARMQPREELLSAAAPSVAPAAGNRQAELQLNRNANDILQGVIWSEVLGPPRAKRPYGR